MDRLLFNFHDVILLMTTYQCTLFALLLLAFRRTHALSNVLLAGFLMTQAAIPLDILINFGAGFRDWAIEVSPNLFFVFGMAYWLEGPVLLWYTRSLIYKDYRLGLKDLVYLLPFIGYGLFEIFTYYSLATEVKIEELRNHDLLAEPAVTHLVGLTRELLRVAFYLMCLLAIRDVRKQIKQEYSNIDHIDFAWLKFLVLAFLAISAWAVLVAVAIISSAHWGVTIDYATMGLSANYTVFVLVSAMIFLSMNYSSVFEGVERRSHGEEDEHRPAGEVIDPALVEKLERHMREQKPFLASTLTLERLAKQLAIPPRTLSKVINRHFGQNFFEFINLYRVEEAKKRLLADEYMDQTILKIMLSSGFNSKATFNTFFKKQVDMTPSQYRKLKAAAPA